MRLLMTNRERRLTQLCACAGLIALALMVFPRVVHADALASSLFVRTDSDHTVVVSPRAHAGKRLDEATQVDVSYAADIWTSASIDIVTSGSKPVTEQRDELDFALAHEFTDLTVSGSYRYSVENDYRSHGATAGVSSDFADNNTTLALNGYTFLDTVGRSGDASFARGLTTLGARASITQVFDSKMLGQLSYELSHLDGYQASPYRVVGVGPNATGYGCMGGAGTQCLPEHEPSSRTRNAFAVLIRRALGDELSLGLNYRFYIDDWQLSSHTATAQLGLLAGPDTTLTLRYRFYSQTGTGFYLPIYHMLAPNQYTTRDREQSPMHDQRVGLDLEQKLALDEQGEKLVLNFGVGGDFYSYARFVGLRSARALELTLAVTLEK
jgi:hypothetical protein